MRATGTLYVAADDASVECCHLVEMHYDDPRDGVRAELRDPATGGPSLLALGDRLYRVRLVLEPAGALMIAARSAA